MSPPSRLLFPRRSGAAKGPSDGAPSVPVIPVSSVFGSLNELGCGQVIKRSVRIAGHPTSVSLETAFWVSLQDIAAERKISLNALITEIDTWRMDHGGGNLSSSLRVYILAWYQQEKA